MDHKRSSPDQSPICRSVRGSQHPRGCRTKCGILGCSRLALPELPWGCLCKSTTYSLISNPNNDYQADELLQPKTDAEFRNTYNPAGKTIIASHNFSPNYQLRKAFGVNRLSPDQAAKLPKVKQWSDVTMILWNSLAGNRAGDLKYIFREYIITSNTRFVMEQCFQGIGQDELLKVWPGQVFKDDDPDFYALLGTPHGMYMKVSL